MNNIDICHNFFYQTGETYDKYYKTVSYYDDVFYSYYTAIARKITGKNGQEYLLLSDNNMSPTTGKHISYLRRACPHYNIILIPQRYGNHYMELNTIINDIKENLKYYADSKLTQKPNRESFTKYYNMLQRINDEIETTDTSLLDDYKTLFEDINNPEKIKEIKKIQAQKQAELRKKLKKELETILNKYDYLTLIQYAYNSYTWLNDQSLDHYNYYKDLNKDLKPKVKKYFNPQDELSFIWFEGDRVHTSQNIWVNRKEVEAMLKLWKHNKAKQGMKIGYYTIISIKPDFVKVGCHKIPTENLQAMYDYMIAEQKAA